MLLAQFCQSYSQAIVVELMSQCVYVCYFGIKRKNFFYNPETLAVVLDYIFFFKDKKSLHELFLF